jgi:hypothetical protein
MIVATVVPARFGDAPMARLVVLRLYPRVMGAFAIVALAVFLVSLDPLLGAVPSSSGPGAAERTAPVSVNRFRKGDRLPLVHPGLPNGQTSPGASRERTSPNGLQTRERPPVGCDPAFSPVSSPAPVVVYGRCMA